MDLGRHVRNRLRAPLNRALARLGVRLVHRDWGPMGQMASLRRLRAHGARPRSIVDVGASTGLWTREVRTIFPEAWVLAVDPLPANRSALEALCREDPRVRAVFGVLGPDAGTRRLVTHGDQSSVFESEAFAGPSIEVVQHALDDLVGTDALPESPDLIKADVQGAELDVLRGATNALRTCRWLLLEVSFKRLYAGAPLAHEVIAFVGERGFRIADVCALLQPAGDDPHQADLLFVRDDDPTTEGPPGTS